MAEEKGLSEREQQILRLVATGASNKEIAHQLVISTNTVKVHLRNIFAKIGVMSRTEATLFAIREGLVQVGEARPGSAAENGAEDAAQAGAAAIAPPLDAPPDPWWRRLGVRRLAAVLAAAVLIVAAAAAAGAVTLGPLVAAPTSTPQPLATSTPAGSRWRLRAPIPTPRAGLAAAATEGRVYAIAGDVTVDGATAPTGANERYDPNTDTWTALAGKPAPVADVAGAVIGGRIYVPGGRLASGAVTSTLEVYDPARDAWETRAPLPVALSAYAMVAFEGRLYVFGGWDGAAFVGGAYEYDPSRDAWTARTPMPTARGFAGAAVAGGKIYVIGGTSDGTAGLDANEEYSPSREGAGAAGPAWRARARMPEGRWGMGVATVADVVHVAGGRRPGDVLTTLQYSAPRDEWQQFESPPTRDWSRLCLVTLETRMYALDSAQDATAGSNMEYQALYTIVIPFSR